MSVESHYDLHLAEHYSWLFGGLPERVTESRAWFEGISVRGPGRALDVGAGSGFQSIPLAQLGFEVTAVDLSEKLLAELRANAVGTTDHDAARRHPPLHRRDARQVVRRLRVHGRHAHAPRELRRRPAAAPRHPPREARPGGRFVVAIRDFTDELRGDARFVPVRADERTVFSCFLEYEGDHVRVYDVIHQRGDDGWDMRVSSYRKLRIDPDWLEKRLVDAGFARSLRERRCEVS